MFQNRSEAGRLLASKLGKYQNIPGVILAVPRGGVPVAYEVAKELNIPLEIILVKKLGHPLNPEYAIGAVGLEDSYVVPHDDVSDQYVSTQIQHIRSKLVEMKKKFMGDRDPEQLEGKTVIVIDDGVATGNTLLATVRILKNSRPAKIIVAVPVASKSAVQLLSNEADEVISLYIPDIFIGVGRFYNDFSQVEDEEVVYFLNKLYQIKEAE